MKNFLTILVASALLVSLAPAPAFSTGRLVKTSSSSTIYFVDDSGVRHAFPNATTYYSWYSDFSGVQEVAPEILQTFTLGPNVTIKPGTKLVKVPSDPKIYAVEPGGTLRHVVDSAIAEGIWGADWQSRLVDVPEVFFSNYVIGQNLNQPYLIPEGTVYRLSSEPTIYWKNRGIFQKFKNEAALVANGYSLADVVTGGVTQYTREQIIAGRLGSIAEPSFTTYSHTGDCQAENLKAAFVLVTRGQPSSQALFTVAEMQPLVADTYSWASSGLSEIDTTFPAVGMIDEGLLVGTNTEGKTVLTQEVTQIFYDQVEDIFDFVFIFTDFDIFHGNELATFTPVTNFVNSLGKIRLDASATHGSRGKLKGVIKMGNVNKFNLSTQSGQDDAANLAMHEIIHSWSGQAKFTDADGNVSNKLLRSPDLTHWSRFTNFSSPLGGLGWTDNGDGTFNANLASAARPDRRSFSDLDLYLMGLLPSVAVDPITYLEPDDPKAVGNTITGEMKTVTIDQVVEALGNRNCALE